MRFIEYLTEVEGEYLPQDKSAAARIARDMLAGAGGDTKVAKQMAQSFLQQLLVSIDDQGLTSKTERPRHSGYEQHGGRSHRGFSRYA